jgi:hypothetical protein
MSDGFVRHLRAISRALIGPAISLLVMVTSAACGSRKPVLGAPPDSPSAPRVLPLNRVIILQTSGPSPSDTSVSFPAGTLRTIVLRQGPPENIVFARVTFPAAAFPDSGQTVTVEVKPRPGVYGLDIGMSRPIRVSATVMFEYARYFSAPERARQVYRTDGAFEQALAIGHLLPENQIELLPSVRPELDHVSAPVATGGSYVVAGPQ